MEPGQLREKIEQLTEVERAVFDAILLLSKEYKSLYTSQKFIADKVGITREHCNRTLRKLKAIGLINSEYRHRNTCIYKVSPMVFIDGMKHILMKYFKVLRSFVVFLPISLLFSGSITPVNTGLICINNTVIKGGMKMQEENPIPVAVREIKSLKLSRAGQIKLSGMPAAAIEHVEKQMQYAKNIRDPFSWFFKLCMDYCVREELSIDWAYVDVLKAKYAIKDDARTLLSQDIHRQRDGLKEKKEYVFKTPSDRPIITKQERDSSEQRLKTSEREVTQRYQFKKWSKQIEESPNNIMLIHSLKHMISNLEHIPSDLRTLYICGECSDV